MTFSLAGSLRPDRDARSGRHDLVDRGRLALSFRGRRCRCRADAAHDRSAARPLMLDQLRRGYSAQQAIDAAIARHARAATGGSSQSSTREGRTASLSRSERQAGARRGARARLRRARQHRPLDDDAGGDGRGIRGESGRAVGHAADRCARGWQCGRRRVQGRWCRPACIVAYREAFPYVDLRVDSDADPIGMLRRLWQEYEPVAEMYVARAVTPSGARIVMARWRAGSRTPCRRTCAARFPRSPPAP